jgi:Mor family transcriptional regulator
MIQRQEEPIKNPLRNHANRMRAAAALRIVTELTAEKQTLLARCRSAPSHEHQALQARLQQLELDLARAQEERRRARAGAPPAPPGHNPLAPPPRPSEVVQTFSYKEPPVDTQTLEQIRTDYCQGKGLNKHALAEKYQLSYRQIQNILRHEDPRPHPTAKLDEAQVRDILRYYLDNGGRRGVITELADRFAVQKSTISDIVRRRSWREIQLE